MVPSAIMQPRLDKYHGMPYGSSALLCSLGTGTLLMGTKVLGLFELFSAPSVTRHPQGPNTGQKKTGASGRTPTKPEIIVGHEWFPLPWMKYCLALSEPLLPQIGDP